MTTGDRTARMTKMMVSINYKYIFSLIPMLQRKKKSLKSLKRNLLTNQMQNLLEKEKMMKMRRRMGFPVS